MRRTATAYAEGRIRIRLGRLVPRPLRAGLVILAGGLGCWVLVVRGQPADGAALGLLAAGGWGLGLIPVHADRCATGPSPRRTGDPAAPVEAEPPIG
ncbi:hypothetical protein J5Y04_29495 [Kitasatospora sp. RG8]|uniref:hypothetical protein n=1 Tax=Kitasatospora sp. RG8 TaxID=2820815 RepID=UPI001AE07C8E|nr:hypothetical protein [Kitasatospora sp. RG8]MBP0453648.1 hypothetical protein [Kitasatospora sp. RG8]